MPEQSIYATDEQTGVWMRGRLDWTTEDALVDLKTSTTAIPSEWSRQAASYEYAIQMQFYRQIWGQITGEADARFLHVVVSKTEPYLVAVMEMDFDYQSVGTSKVRRALDLYKKCLDTDTWPGIPPIIHRLSPPAYYINAEEELEAELEIH